MTEKIEQLIQDGIGFYIKKDWEKAKKAFEDVLSIAPENREACAFLGSILVWQRNFSGALVRFESVGADDPPRKYLQGEWGKILNDWGRMLVELKRYDEAIEKFKKSIDFDPENRHINLRNWGWALEKQGEDSNRYEDAAKQYEAAVNADEKFADAWNDWGRMLVELKRYDEAIAKFQKALDIDSRNKHFYLFNWGRALEYQEENPNRYEDAAKQYEAAVNADEQYPDAWNGWGLMLLELKQYNEAINKFQRALDIDTKNKHIYYYNWGLALERQEENPNRYADAAKQFEAAVNADEKYDVAWNSWGRMLLELKRYDEAINKFQRALDIDTKNKHIYYYNWGLALERQEENPNRYEDAAKQYEAAVNADEKYDVAWNSWGRMLLELKRYDEAIAKFQKALDIDSRNKHIYLFNWGLALEDQEGNPNRYEDAAKQYEAAVNADDKYTNAWNGWGRTLLELKYYEKAIEKFKKIVDEIDPKYKYAYYNWGDALEKQDLYEDAEKQYRMAVQVDPEYADAYRKLAEILLKLKKHKAITELIRASGADVKYKKVYYTLGDVLLTAERYAEARMQFEKAESVDSSYVDAVVGNGLSMISLGLYDEAVEKLNTAIQLDPTRAHPHYILGWIFANGKKEYDKAIEQYESALKLDSAYFSVQINYGYLLVELSRYDEAEEKFRKLPDTKKDLPDKYHALAYLFERIGRYKEAQSHWREALNRYIKITDNEKTAADWSFIAQIHAYIFQDYDKALLAIKAGLAKYPESSDILRAAIDINLEAKEKCSYESPQNLGPIGTLHWDAHNAYKRLRMILEERIKTFENPAALLDLGSVCKSMGELDEATKYMEKAIALDPDLSGAYNTLGAIKSNREEYKDAIQDFRVALNKQQHDFGYASNLAEAYRKAKLLDQAEKEYQKILNIAPAHMDSLIGLGETYAAMGDAAKEGSRTADAELMYTQAIENYSRVIGFEEKRSGGKKDDISDASKRLKLKELNAVYYARGYARVSLYDVQSRKEDYLLQQAKSDFTKLLKYEADENFHKAKRAVAKISDRLSFISPQNIESRTGPLIVALLAFLLFAVNLFAFFKGRPELTSPGYALTDQSLEVLDAVQLPPEAMERLDALVGKEFATQEGLLAAIELVVGEEAFKSYEKVLLAQPLEAPPELQWEPIDVGYFALMAFGSLIFMVAGLYLQQISKLKFGSIEIEKSSVSQISSSGALGIPK